MNYALQRNYPLYLSTKNTILKAYDGRFKDLFQQMFDSEFKEQFAAKGLTYEHRLIDDMVASSARNGRAASSGRVRITMATCSPTRWRKASASLGLMTSVLVTPDGKTVEAEAAHGTVTRHYREHQKEADLDQLDRVDFRLEPRPQASRQVGRKRGVGRFAETLERVVVETIESGFMTKDLALLVGDQQAWLSTEGFLDKIDGNLQKALA